MSWYRLPAAAELVPAAAELVPAAAELVLAAAELNCHHLHQKAGKTSSYDREWQKPLVFFKMRALEEALGSGQDQGKTQAKAEPTYFGI
eukprot:SAG11_NODE_15684_length_569_cov_1.463830_1_plen_89_part_00